MKNLIIAGFALLVTHATISKANASNGKCIVKDEIEKDRSYIDAKADLVRAALFDKGCDVTPHISREDADYVLVAANYQNPNPFGPKKVAYFDLLKTYINSEKDVTLVSFLKGVAYGANDSKKPERKATRRLARKIRKVEKL